MRKLLLCLLALFCVTAQGCIFANGFEKECPVIIGYGSYELLGPQVTASQSGADFDSDPAYLVDGKPGTLVNAHWSLTGTTSDYVGIQVFPAFSGSTGGDDVPIGVVALLNTDLPKGMVIQCYVNGSIVGHSTMQPTPTSNRTSAWFIFDIAQTGGNTVQVRLLNNVGGSTVMSTGQSFTMGEMFAGNVAEFNMKRTPKFSYETTPRIRVDANGVSYPVLMPIVRNISLQLCPILQKQAFTNQTPLNAASVMRDIFTADVVAVVPFLNFEPVTYGVQSSKVEPAIISQTAFLGQFGNAPTISMNGDQYYEISMTFKESA